MDKYIKVSDMLEVISKMQTSIQKDYEEEKISQMSLIAMIGTLEVLKEKINKK